MGALQGRFQGVRAFALPPVIDYVRRQDHPERMDGFWRRRFPGQIPDERGTAEPVPHGGLQLEGHDLVPVWLGHTDTDATTCLHVPSAGLVVAGDAADNDVHLLLAESDPVLRRERIAAGALLTSALAVKAGLR